MDEDDKPKFVVLKEKAPKDATYGSLVEKITSEFKTTPRYIVFDYEFEIKDAVGVPLNACFTTLLHCLHTLRGPLPMGLVPFTVLFPLTQSITPVSNTTAAISTTESALPPVNCR